MKELLNKYNENYFYSILVVILFVSSSVIILNAYDAFPSDFPWHINVMRMISSLDFSMKSIQDFQYPHIFSYPLYHILSILLNIFVRDIKMSSALIVIISNISTIFIVRHFCRSNIIDRSSKKLYLIDFFSVFSIVLMPLSSMLTYNSYYLPQGSPNNYHNPTSIVMRPFALLTFISFLRVFQLYKLNTSHYKKEILLFSIFLFLTTLVKPNFAIFFLIAAGLCTSIFIFGNLWANLKLIGIPLLISVLPTILLMLLQKMFIDYFEPSELTLQISNLTTIFTISNFRYFISNSFLIILPLVIGIKIKKSDLGLMLTIVMYLIGLFVWFFTIQGIYSLSNYQWSYFVSLFFMNMYCAIYILNSKSKFCWIWWLIFTLHCIYGFLYIYNILCGNGYH